MSNDMRLLNVPTETSVRYKTNFITTAVCEFKFPILLELEEKLPIKFGTALKKKYPLYSKEQRVSISESGATPTGYRYTFESRKKDWLVTIKPDALSLQTSKYTTFKDFYKCVAEILNTVGVLLDTDFFTRIGLRYINAIPIDDGTVEGWVNPLLITPIQDGSLGTLSKFHGEIRGFITNGAYTFRHGFDQNSIIERAPTKYILDFDYFAEGVEFSDALPVMAEFNKYNFSFFRWAIADKAKEMLGVGEEKK